jgi:replication factor C subunit 2/4
MVSGAAFSFFLGSLEDANQFVFRTLGYSSHDIISTMFRVTKTIPTLSEHSKLEFIKEIGFTHMRILDGVQSLLQLSGCVAKLCRINMKPELFKPKA